MLVIRYPGAEEKTKEQGKFLLRLILLPPSASPNVNLPQTPTPDTDTYPSHTPLSCPDSQPLPTSAGPPTTPVTPSSRFQSAKQLVDDPMKGDPKSWQDTSVSIKWKRILKNSRNTYVKIEWRRVLKVLRYIRYVTIQLAVSRQNKKK